MQRATSRRRLFNPFSWGQRGNPERTTASPMEIPQRRDGSGDAFSFPSTPAKECIDSEFEFGSITPDSPSSDMRKTSPADHLFFNGRLLPHYFPSQTTTMLLNGNSRPTPSRTSSVSCKDSYSPSLVSSRSNSVNSSRSSSCSSGRTSYSGDGSERRLLCQNRLAAMTTRSTRERHSKAYSNKDDMAQLYGSQRWQFIASMPALSRETSSRRKKADEMIIREEAAKPKKEKSGSRRHRGFCRKFLESFMSTCRQCHAMEAQVKDEMICL